MHKKPSHIVVPAIHIKKEEIGELFVKEMGTEPDSNDRDLFDTCGTCKNLRHKFIEAEAAMTGANFAVASTGEFVVCTNEGNADMGTLQPKLQIAAGLEKIVPDREALGVFTRLLARSGTGQPITTYTSHYRKPRKGGELHIIIVDNGRSNILARSGACKDIELLAMRSLHEYMSGVPSFRRIFLYLFYSGPIGINLEC